MKIKNHTSLFLSILLMLMFFSCETENENTHKQCNEEISILKKRIDSLNYVIDLEVQKSAMQAKSAFKLKKNKMKYTTNLILFTLSLFAFIECTNKEITPFLPPIDEITSYVRLHEDIEFIEENDNRGIAFGDEHVAELNKIFIAHYGGGY